MHALKHVVTIQTATTTDDGQGGQVFTWSDTVTLMAHIAARTGAEFLQAGVLQNAARIAVRVPFHQAVTVKTRIVREPSGPTYEVLEVTPVEKGDSVRWLDLQAIEVDV